MSQKVLPNILEVRREGSIMKKVTIRIFVLCICFSVMISCLAGCFYNSKQDIYEIETDLGDRLSIEVYLSGNLHGMYLTYHVTSEDYSGIAMFQDRTQTTIPAEPLEYFTTIGAYGNTHFYKLNNVIFYVYNCQYINGLNPKYNFYKYINGFQYRDEKENDRFIAIISDLMKAGNFENIYQYGEILAYERNDEIKLILQRYAEGDFTEEELSINENSEKTTEEMMLWAKEILKQYFPS